MDDDQATGWGCTDSILIGTASAIGDGAIDLTDDTTFTVTGTEFSGIGACGEQNHDFTMTLTKI